MPVGHPRDQRPQPDPFGGCGQRREQRPGLHARSAAGAVQRLEVIEDPRPVEPGFLGEPDAPEELVPLEVVLRHVQPEPHRSAWRAWRSMATGRAVVAHPLMGLPSFHP